MRMRLASPVFPAARCRWARAIRSHNCRVKGTAAPGGGGSGTRRAITAAHSSVNPSPVRAETWIALGAEVRSQAGGKSLLLTTYITAARGSLGQTGGAEP